MFYVAIDPEESMHRLLIRMHRPSDSKSSEEYSLAIDAAAVLDDPDTELEKWDDAFHSSTREQRKPGAKATNH